MTFRVYLKNLALSHWARGPKMAIFLFVGNMLVYPKLGSEEVTTDDKIRFSILINSS